MVYRGHGNLSYAACPLDKNIRTALRIIQIILDYIAYI